MCAAATARMSAHRSSVSTCAGTDNHDQSIAGQRILAQVECLRLREATLCHGAFTAVRKEGAQQRHGLARSA